MDPRYLPFYGGLYGGINQPALYSLYSGYLYPFGWYGGYGTGCCGYDYVWPSGLQAGYGSYPAGVYGF